MLLLALVLLGHVSPAFAQAKTAVFRSLPFERGPGSYLSVPKLVLAWLLFVLWVRTSDWVNYDCLLRRDKYVIWNSLVFFSFVASFILMWLIPWFALGYFLMLVGYAAPLGIYIWKRNAQVEPHEKVLTREHMRHLAAGIVGKLGIRMSGEKQQAQDKGPPVMFTPQGGATERDNTANLLTARQSPGFLLARELFADAISKKAEGVMLECTTGAAALRYQLDGVWHDNPPRERADADALVSVLKTFANLNVKERRAKQKGTFTAEYLGQKLLARINTLGTERGERVTVEFAGKAAGFTNLDQIGMRDKVQQQFKELIGQDKGLIIISALPSGGLSATFDAVLRSTDRFLRDFVAVEEVDHREREVENVQVTTYDAKQNETPATLLAKLVRTYPNVFVVRDPLNAETMKILTDQVADNRMAIVSTRAKDSVEAVLRVLMLKAPIKDVAKSLTCSLNVRLVRKLCDTCKVSYRPSADTLKQLGIPDGKVEAFFRPPTPDPKQPDKVCKDCRGIGYRGRTGIFELLVVDAQFRETMLKSPKLDVLKIVARKSGLKTLQDEGVLLLAKGVTSLPELSRALKL